MEKENDKGKEKETEKSWYVYDSNFRCYGNPRDCQWKFEKRKKVLHSRAAPPDENRPLPPLAPQNRPRPQPPRRNPKPPTAYRADGTFITRVNYNGQMVETWSQMYVGGNLQYMGKCHPEKWSKLEVDDFLKMLGVEVRGLDYYYLKPGKDLKEDLVRLSDNNSWMEMAKIGFCKGAVDLFALDFYKHRICNLSK